MAGRNWLGTFGGTKSFNVNSELDRGYEAALLIQSLELEYYGDRPIRPDLELSVPSTVQQQSFASSGLLSTSAAHRLTNLNINARNLTPRSLDNFN